MSTSYKITLIGCGRMGGAMLKGWLASDIDATYNIVEPYGQPDFTKGDNRITFGETVKSISDDVAKSDICILAVKPQMMMEVCEALKHIISDDCLILSVAAGQTIGNFENYFGANQPIVRVMPNTPASIGEGMSVAVANAHPTDSQKEIVTRMLDCSGKSAWVDDENLMNAVTAVSGSGPAYIFHLIEALAKAGENVGLDADKAMILARQTVVGSAALAASEADTPASTLRENVTSPGGTTAAALNVLMDGRFQDILNEALQAAKKRGEELGG
ncbi:MAG: pyrroline-5-carboxylate reductase [Alphaproteobacteria bacterium]|nr:pyrroline-5-carboxylate reductase [Alphaproteobacteria bacterium]